MFTNCIVPNAGSHLTAPGVVHVWIYQAVPPPWPLSDNGSPPAAQAQRPAVWDDGHQLFGNAAEEFSSFLTLLDRVFRGMASVWNVSGSFSDR